MKFKNLLLTLISITLTLFFSEIAIRIIAPQQLILIRPDVWCPHPSLGWKLCPNVDTTLNSGEGTIHIQTDSEGHRIDKKHLPEYPDLKVLAIGDSFVEAIQVNDSETTPERIAQILEQNRKQSVSVTNAGTGQWNPNHYLIAARKELESTNYNIGLVFIYLGNDVVSEVKEHFEPREPTHHRQVVMNQTKPWQESLNHFLYPINDFLRTRSHLYILFKKAFSTILMRFGLSGNTISPVFLKNYTHSNDWEITASIFKKIGQEFEQQKVPVIFVLIPTSYQVDTAEFSKFTKAFNIPVEETDLEQPNKILKELLKSEGLIVLDPLIYFRNLHENGIKLYGSIDNHLNASGYFALAKFVVPAIENKIHPNR